MPTFPLRFEDYALPGQNVVVTAPELTATYLYVEGLYDLPVIGYTAPEVRFTASSSYVQQPSGLFERVDTVLVTVVTGLRLINGLITEQTMSVEFRGYQFTALVGSAGQDSMVGSNYGTGIIQGDSSDGPGGDDIIRGALASDIRPDGDTLLGMGGNDTVYGGGAWSEGTAEYLYGDANGDDQGNENVADGNDFLYGGDGDSWFFGGGGENWLYCNDDLDDVVSWAKFYANELSGQYFYVDANLQTGLATVWRVDPQFNERWVAAVDHLDRFQSAVGTQGNDTIITPNDSAYGFGWFEGLGGDDTITAYAEGGIYGGNGNDRLTATGPLTDVYGGIGNDTIIMQGALTTGAVYAGDGADVVYCAQSNLAWMFGGKGDDKFFGGGATDKVSAGTGNDLLIGNAGNDNLNGEGDADTLNGGGGQDSLSGGFDDDNLRGGAGADLLQGGTGRDVLFGGAGRDVFVYNVIEEVGIGATRDRIRDFVTGADWIDLSGVQSQVFLIGTARFSGVAGEVRYSSTSGLLIGDENGDRVADWQIDIGVGTVIAATDFA